jgi:hypothetical protein
VGNQGEGEVPAQGQSSCHFHPAETFKHSRGCEYASLEPLLSTTSHYAKNDLLCIVYNFVNKSNNHLLNTFTATLVSTLLKKKPMGYLPNTDMASK